MYFSIFKLKEWIEMNLPLNIIVRSDLEMLYHVS